MTLKIRENPRIHFTSVYLYRQLLSRLPKMSEWICDEIKWALGDSPDGESEMCENLHLWRKDVMQVIQELFENPDYKEDMCYTPLKLYADKEKTERIYNETWTGDLWHDLAVR